MPMNRERSNRLTDTAYDMNYEEILELQDRMITEHRTATSDEERIEYQFVLDAIDQIIHEHDLDCIPF